MISLLALWIASCTGVESKPSVRASEITLTPVDLFKGEGAKFRPFLGAWSGAFKLSYKGMNPHATLDIDLWQNGQKVKTIGSIGDMFYSSEARNRDALEVIISMDKVTIDAQAAMSTIKVGTRRDSGTNTYVFTVPWDGKLTGTGLILESRDPRTLRTNEPAHVWGMHATSTNEIRTLDFTPEALSRIEWAIIFTLRFDESEKKLN
ncbi:hypothetical protein [Paenibacillus qinlingensis]|nr:hypothetical protein [Paenibacillus qinlingensis]